MTLKICQMYELLGTFELNSELSLDFKTYFANLIASLVRIIAFGHFIQNVVALLSAALQLHREVMMLT